MSGLQSPLSEVCGAPTKSHQCLCVLISLPVQLEDSGLCGSIITLGAFCSARDAEVQWCWRLPEERFSCQDGSVSLGQSCVCWQNTLPMRGKAGGELHQVEFLIPGTGWGGFFCLSPLCWSTLSHTLPLIVFLCLLDQKEGLTILMPLLKH